MAFAALHTSAGSESDAAAAGVAPISDERLVERCRAGSEEAFATVVGRYEAALVRHCSRIVGRSAAEDAVQEAFVAAWIALRAGAEVRGLRPWLFTIARRKALNARARTQPSGELSDAIGGDRSAADQAAESARAHDALAALAALPVAQRDALVGSALLGFSGEQLARRLGVGEPTIRQLVFRARERLRAAACLASPLALARLFRHGARGAAGPGPVAAGTAAKAAVVVAVAAAAVGAGVGLHSGGQPRHAPLTRARPLATARHARRTAAPSTAAADSTAASSTAAADHTIAERAGRPVGFSPASPRRSARHLAARPAQRVASGGAHHGSSAPLPPATASSGSVSTASGSGQAANGSAADATAPAGGSARGLPARTDAATPTLTPAVHPRAPATQPLGATVGSAIHSGTAVLSGIASKAGSALRQGVSTVTAGATAALGGANTAVGGVGTVAQGAGTVVAGLGTVAQGAGSVAQGAGTVVAGLGTVAQGAGSVVQGAGTVVAGVGTVAQGAGSVTQGAGTVAAGVGTATAGGAVAASGIAKAVVGGATGAVGGILAGRGPTGASGLLGVGGIG